MRTRQAPRAVTRLLDRALELVAFAVVSEPGLRLEVSDEPATWRSKLAYSFVLCTLLLALPITLGLAALMVLSMVDPSQRTPELGSGSLGYFAGLVAAVFATWMSLRTIRVIIARWRGRPVRRLRLRWLVSWLLSLGVGVPLLVFLLYDLPETWDDATNWLEGLGLTLLFLLAPRIATREEQAEGDDGPADQSHDGLG